MYFYSLIENLQLRIAAPKFEFGCGFYFCVIGTLKYIIGLKYHSEDALIRDYLKSLFKLLFPHETMAYYKVGTLHRGIQFYNNIISNIK